MMVNEFRSSFSKHLPKTCFFLVVPPKKSPENHTSAGENVLGEPWRSVEWVNWLICKGKNPWNSKFAPESFEGQRWVSLEAVPALANLSCFWLKFGWILWSFHQPRMGLMHSSDNMAFSQRCPTSYEALESSFHNCCMEISQRCPGTQLLPSGNLT